MTIKISGLPFQLVCEIIPELDSSGMPKDFMPQFKYRNVLRIPLHKYGNGPFCRFRIPNGYDGKVGVYVVLVNGSVKYVGECEDLRKRWKAGYGNISPRNCYRGGRSTNCRINNLIFKTYGKGSKIELVFHETNNRFRIENDLIAKLNPEWNKMVSRVARTNRISLRIIDSKRSRTDGLYEGKYHKLEEYLRKSQNQAETLTYEQIERIIGSGLPLSAYKYRAWWANTGHSHAKTWSRAGWKVSQIELGEFIKFVITSKTK